jgi:hypothetical protein
MMSDLFPRTEVGGVSVSRMIVGSNWFLGYSHTSLAKDKFIRERHDRTRIADVLEVFFNAGVDTVMGPAHPLLIEAVHEAEDRTGRQAILVLTPGFTLKALDPEKPRDMWDPEPEDAFDTCQKMGATFCFPHQQVTDALIDRRAGVIRDLDVYTKMIRDRGMIPGLSTHMPEAVIYADRQQADVASYIQLYNAAGFLMQVEVDWVMRIIRDAQKPVMTIKPMAAGRLIPAVGLAFAWNTIRDQDMVTVGTTTPDEARECIELSLDFLCRRMPENQLQTTRSKRSLQ